MYCINFNIITELQRSRGALGSGPSDNNNAERLQYFIVGARAAFSPTNKHLFCREWNLSILVPRPTDKPVSEHKPTSL